MQKNTSIPQSGSLIVPMTNDYLFRALHSFHHSPDKTFVPIELAAL